MNALTSHDCPFHPARTTNLFRSLRQRRFTVDVCRIEGARLSYKRLWKPKTMKACKLSGARRAVLGALLLVCDGWNGRVRKAYHEIAEIAGVSPRRCADILAEFIDKGYVNLLEAGRGRRPTMIQVVPADQIK